MSAPELPQRQPWNSLEIAKLVVSASTPLVVLVVGFLLNTRLTAVQVEASKATQAAQQEYLSRQKLTDWRFETYARIAPLLNRIYCYVTFIGVWKEMSPLDVISDKREADTKFYSAQFLFTRDTVVAYEAFMASAFVMNRAANEDAKIRSVLTLAANDRKLAYELSGKDAGRLWDSAWDDRFDVSNPDYDIAAKYNALHQSITRDLGIQALSDYATPERWVNPDR